VGLHRRLARAAVGPGLAALRGGPDEAGIVAAVEDGRNWRAGAREMREADPAMTELVRMEAAGFPPGLPVTVVVGGLADRRERRSRPVHVELTRREMAAHPRGRHVVATGSSHYVPWQEPALVADEVLRAVTLLRGAGD
jgi:pimeloyl-ACP methyl ester carboxylesterase